MLNNIFLVSSFKNILYLVTLHLGFISFILFSNASTFFIFKLESRAIICLFLFVISIVSASTIIMFSIPFLISVSTTYPPTPPTPITTTVLVCNLFKFSLPINLSNLSNIFLPHKKMPKEEAGTINLHVCAGGHPIIGFRILK